MRFRDKLKEYDSSRCGRNYRGGCFGHPYMYGFETKEEGKKQCDNDCDRCWDREYTGQEIGLRRAGYGI